jgi:hypothetical protein
MHDRVSPLGVIISLLVMAVARVAAKYHHSISAIKECLYNKQWVYSPRTGNPDDADIVRIFDAARSRKISACIAAPIAEETYNFWFKGTRHVLISSFSYRGKKWSYDIEN